MFIWLMLIKWTGKLQMEKDTGILVGNGLTDCIRKDSPWTDSPWTDSNGTCLKRSVK